LPSVSFFVLLQGFTEEYIITGPPPDSFGGMARKASELTEVNPKWLRIVWELIAK